MEIKLVKKKMMGLLMMTFEMDVMLVVMKMTTI